MARVALVNTLQASLCASLPDLPQSLSPRILHLGFSQETTSTSNLVKLVGVFWAMRQKTVRGDNQIHFTWCLKQAVNKGGRLI